MRSPCSPGHSWPVASLDSKSRRKKVLNKKTLNSVSPRLGGLQEERREMGGQPRALDEGSSAQKFVGAGGSFLEGLGFRV